LHDCFDEAVLKAVFFSTLGIRKPLRRLLLDISKFVIKDKMKSISFDVVFYMRLGHFKTTKDITRTTPVPCGHQGGDG